MEQLLEYDHVDETLFETLDHKTGRIPMKITHVEMVYYHWHEEYEFILNTAPAVCVINGVSRELMPGDAILAERHELHGRYLDKNASTSMIGIIVHPDFVNGPAEYGTDLPSKLHFQQFFSHNDPKEKEVIDWLNKIVEIDRERGFGFEYRMEAAIKQVFSLMIRYRLFTERNDDGIESSGSSRLQMMVSFIRENYAQPITLNDLSKCSHYSKHYIIKLFQKYTLVPPMEYIRNYRLMIATNMLKNTDHTIQEIAIACGFSNVSYFTRCFKNVSNLSPTEYRKIMRSNS